MTALPTSFYVRDGDRLASTELTRGPWSRDSQHGGPPAALLARAIEGHGEDAARFVVTRLTVDFLKTVPLAPLTVSCEVVRAGRQVQRHLARLFHEGIELARACSVRVRRARLALPPPLCPPSPPLSPLAAAPPFTFDFFADEPAYHRAVELRWVRGTWGKGPAAAWMRLVVPLVEGEAVTPLQRVATLADAANGVCPALPIPDFTFVNPDLTIHLGREPEGEWVGIDARSNADELGIGLVDAELHDERGPFGRSLQGLVVEKR